MLKQTFKNYIGQHISKIEFPLVVNSYGRSGSTVLTKSIIKNSISVNNTFLNNLACRAIDQSSWDLCKTDFKEGIVYKSHDYPPTTYSNKNLKMLYVFANPVDVVLSLLRLFDERGEKWMKIHYQHLGVSYTNTNSIDQILNKDQLHLESHLDSWLKETRIPIAFVKYEYLWEHQKDLTQFLGIPIALPPFKQRNAKDENNLELKEILNDTYSSLLSKINNFDNFFIN